MKSYKDKQLLIGLLFLGIAAGATGRFFESQRISFPAAGSLATAAAILATEENIIGKPIDVAETAVSLGFSDSTPTDAEISFTKADHCTDPFTIQAKNSYTVGFLCLSAKDPMLSEKVSAAATKVNALAVSLNFGTGMNEEERETAAHRAIDAGAVMIVGFGPKASVDTSYYGETPIIYSLGEPATAKVKRPSRVSVTATLTGKSVSAVVIRAQ